MPRLLQRPEVVTMTGTGAALYNSRPQVVYTSVARGRVATEDCNPQVIQLQFQSSGRGYILVYILVRTVFFVLFIVAKPHSRVATNKTN